MTRPPASDVGRKRRLTLTRRQALNGFPIGTRVAQPYENITGNSHRLGQVYESSSPHWRVGLLTERRLRSRKCKTSPEMRPAMTLFEIWWVALGCCLFLFMFLFLLLLLLLFYFFIVQSRRRVVGRRIQALVRGPNPRGRFPCPPYGRFPRPPNLPRFLV